MPEMGAIVGEDLVEWEKMQAVSGQEERILVLVRLRPLSEKEVSVNEVADWECINDTTIFYRNTLREGSTFPSAHKFDRVFRGECSTKQVYEEGTKEIALSVVNGINSSIFAYGQTSSGKTYTMTGITENTIADIFDYINKHEERAFALKFSAIEIYNEIVRDLLSTDNTPLRLRDDPERGPVLDKLTEETLRDWGHLKELLSFCEAQRQVGETYMNEKSSRSHQIIRLTVESSAREFLGKDKSTSLAASVNFVDLAGSERASQALSAGTRLKEGCHINRSLLTLGTVIRKLSKGKHGHINYRDSKLTRILQPSLGGNARTAIICTLSPARRHVEQTRNTLFFASCAKEVTTKAQVNVVMSDKALVKHLQREVARLENELRMPGPATSNCDCLALLKKKDLQIEKMEKEIRELTKQLDLAQSRIEDLLQMTGNDGKPRKEGEDTWEDGYSVSESSSSSVPCLPDPRIRDFNNPHHNDGDKSESDEYLDEDCKEVQCVEDGSSRDNSENLVQSRSDNGVSTLPKSGEGHVTGQGMLASVNEDGDVSDIQGNSTYGPLEHGLHDMQMTGESPVYTNLGEQSPQTMSVNMSKFKDTTLTRSWSCKEHIMVGSPERARQLESTPSNGFEKGFPGRPETVVRKFPQLTYDAATRLSRNDSQSSIGSSSIDELRADSMRTCADFGITSIQSFVAGMKEMVKVQYENELVDAQAQKTETPASNMEKNVKDVGTDPMLEEPESQPESPLNWHLQFEKQQKEIVELWHTCYISLIHRTYFFLLFRGDPSDSIYMEVELRRLSFLQETITQGNHFVKNGQAVTLASSLKTLQREREMLIKLMQKRLSEEERKILFMMWGISLHSKRRRMQLANRLWSNTDMNLIRESAAIVGKLVRFSEQGKTLKGMFGLSFTPHHHLKKRLYSWKSSSALLL